MSRRALKRVTVGAAALAALSAVPAFATLTISFVPADGLTTAAPGTQENIAVWATIASDADATKIAWNGVQLLSGELSLTAGTGKLDFIGTQVGVSPFNNTGSQPGLFSDLTQRILGDQSTAVANKPFVVRGGSVPYNSTTPVQSGSTPQTLGSHVQIGQIKYTFGTAGTADQLTFLPVNAGDPRDAIVWTETTASGTSYTVKNGNTGVGATPLTLTSSVVSGTAGRWIGAAGASWDATGSWDDHTVPAVTTALDFNNAHSAGGIVDVNSPHTISNSINFAGPVGYDLQAGVAGSLQLGDATHAAVSVTVADSHTISAPLSIYDGATVTKTGTGTLTLSGVQTHGAGATLVVGAQAPSVVAGGDVQFNSNPGQQGVSGAAAVANLAINVQEGAVHLNSVAAAPVGGLPDVHVVKSLTTSEDGSGKNAKIYLGAGDPFGIGAGGTVYVQSYPGGTANGNQPSRSDIENAWLQVIYGYYSGGSYGGITTTAITHPSLNTLAIQVGSDAGFGGGGAGATSLAYTSDIIGDANGDFAVDGTDLGQILQNINLDPASKGYGLFTWIDGDMNGDGAVDGTDLGAVLSHMGMGYDPTGGSAASMASAAVPEPASLGLIGLAGLALCARRRRDSK